MLNLAELRDVRQVEAKAKTTLKNQQIASRTLATEGYVKTCRYI